MIRFDSDITGLVDAATGLPSRLTPIMRRESEASAARMSALVAKQMDTSGPGEGKFSESNRLGNRTGSIPRAFRTGAPGNQTKVTTTDDATTIVIAPSQEIARRLDAHQRGMFVKSKGRMHLYFLARYAETNEPGFLAMAFTALPKATGKRKDGTPKKGGKGGIQLSKRDPVTPAFEEFKRVELPRLATHMNEQAARIWNAL